MASYFDRLDRSAQAIVTGLTGEPVAVIGMEGGQYSRAPDSGRPEHRLIASVARSPRVDKISAGVVGGSMPDGQRGFLFNELWIDVQNVEAMPWRLRKDDVIVTDPDLPTARRYTVSAVHPLDNGDLQVIFS
jgi:hypothetical protein